ncbi:MAG: RNA helicase [Trueperaceae bacterium]|jgi:ATP-dependent RNA helicase RhlE|nr:RNA helicase [Trueperaceae bacterium]|tara:strand:+ start:1229 stop:2551 length:1323 start_codon:yes stop_codon:yes gene_type:complete
MSFSDFGLHPKVGSGINAAGYLEPTPIQEKAIPLVMAGRDVMGLAQTGTGKTAAFALPILHRLIRGRRGQVRALIVAPTRELAEQINDSFRTLGRGTGLRSATVYGGVGMNPQIRALDGGAEVIVACPGRLLDHLSKDGSLLRDVEVLVLDEADHMFDMGFLPDIRRILRSLPPERQTLMFSATMPRDIQKLAQEALKEPKTVQVDLIAPAKTVSHAIYPLEKHQKTAMLKHVLKQLDPRATLVFTRTKHRAKRLAQQLERSGYRAVALQGNMSQNKRQQALDGFRKDRYQILVATDIAARGIDIIRVSHVINYDMPSTADAYTHRIGRTGRAERSGDAFTFVTTEDSGMIRIVERLLGEPLKRVRPEGFDYNTSPPKGQAEFDRGSRHQGQKANSSKSTQRRSRSNTRNRSNSSKGSYASNQRRQNWRRSGSSKSTRND